MRVSRPVPASYSSFHAGAGTLGPGGLSEARAQLVEAPKGCPLIVRSCLQAATRSTGATTSITGQANQPVCEQVGFCAVDEGLPDLNHHTKALALT